jgi:hypothetical protein
MHVVRKFLAYVIRAQQNFCTSKQTVQKLQLRVQIEKWLKMPYITFSRP